LFICLLPPLLFPGITVFAIGIGAGVNEGELNTIGNSPAEQFVFKATDFDTLILIRDNFLQATCVILAGKPRVIISVKPHAI
jgi:hypothetical protein